MRALSVGGKAWLAANNAGVFFDAFTLTTSDGATYRWVTGEVAVVLSGSTYQPAGQFAPVVDRGAFNNSILPTIDTLDLTLTGGAFRINGKTLAQQAVAKYFQGGRLRVDHYFGPDIFTAISFGGCQALFEGRVGQPEPSGTHVVLHCNAETITLQQARPLVVLQPSCNYAVYDANCGLSRVAFTLAGAASGVPTVKSIPTTSAALTAKAAGYFDLGFITFTSGLLNGVTVDVDTWNGSTFALATQLPQAPAAGDTFTVCPGCHLTLADCGNKFANATTAGHWRGFTHIPTPEAGT